MSGATAAFPVFVAAFVVVLMGCPTPTGMEDSGVTDAGPVDAGSVDSGVVDAGPTVVIDFQPTRA